MSCVAASISITPQWLDAAAKASAALGALVFFLWKFSRGYHVVDARLSLELNRCSLTDQEDCVNVTLKIAKGSNGAIALHDIAAQATYDEKVETKQLPGALRLSYSIGTDPPGQHQIAWNRTSKTSPFVNLAPGDETEFSTFFLVPKRVVCLIEVTVLGLKTGKNWKCQWRASRVSIPVSEQGSAR